MRSVGDISRSELKLFIKSVKDQFKEINAKIDRFESPSITPSTDDKLKKIAKRVREFDSSSPRDYLDWEYDVERRIGDFPHSSRRLGAIIAKKLVGYPGSVWSIHMMGRKKDVSWDYIKRTLREYLVPSNCHEQLSEDHDHEEQVDGAVDVSSGNGGEVTGDTVVSDVEVIEHVVEKETVIVEEDSHSHLVEEPFCDSYVLELEAENHETVVVNQVVPEKLELVEEAHVVELEKSKEFQTVDAVNPIDRGVELQDLNNCNWVTVNAIDRVHDEWYEIAKKQINIMGQRAKITRAPWVDAERLWELLIKREYAELEDCHEPRSAGHTYLTIFQFCRLVFDPGGRLYKFEDEFSQEGGNDTIWVASMIFMIELQSQGTKMDRRRIKEALILIKSLKAACLKVKAASLENVRRPALGNSKPPAL